MGLELVFELVFLRQKAKVKGRPSEFGEFIDWVFQTTCGMSGVGMCFSGMSSA